MLFDAFALLKSTRPKLRGVAGAADGPAEAIIRKTLSRAKIEGVAVVRGVHQAIAQADAAWVSSGTAVLECALSGVPVVALYIISRSLVAHARRVYSGRFITIPNLVLQREVVPELLQEQATPQALANCMDSVLARPAQQYEAFARLREALGPQDALELCAHYAVKLAGGGAC